MKLTVIKRKENDQGIKTGRQTGGVFIGKLSNGIKSETCG